MVLNSLFLGLWLMGNVLYLCVLLDEETNGYSAQYSSTGSTDMGSTTDEGMYT